MRQLPIPAVTSKYWAFRGGMDQVSPSISIDPGRVTAASNVEVGSNGGLTVTKGYERYDGRTSPSDGAYSIIEATITGSYALGDTLTGVTSAATAVIVAATATYFVVTKVTGTFQSGETLNISGSGVATATSANMQGAAATAALNATYKNLAADEYRDDIAAVPGSGSILGVWQYAGDVYAIRNNAGGTAAVMHKSTTSGWSAVSLGREVAFTSGGTTEIAIGNTVTGATSAATAVVGRVVVTSGTWGAGTAAGFLYLTSQTGTFQAENLDVGASPNLATIAGNSSAVSLTAGGRYEFVNYNFGGTAGTDKMYACSGVHKAFEWDGTRFAYITTGMTADTPDHVIAHKNHLFLAFNGSIQHSSIGDPVSWSVVLGAAELGAGENITNFLAAPGGTTGGALIIYTRNKTLVLYGNDAADWNLVTFSPEAGALEWTGQYVGQGIALDDRGVTLMSTSQAFGNFANAVASTLVRPYINALRDTAIASCVVREKNQYRLFFSGGASFWLTFAGRKLMGITQIDMTDAVTCIASQEGSGGREEIYFGSTDGFVYQMDKGTSFDGDEIPWNMNLAYNNLQMPRQLKSFTKAVVEIEGTSYAEFGFAYSMGYGSTEFATPDTVTTESALSGSVNWDSFTWDAFTWDGVSLAPSESDVTGTSENISLYFGGSSDEFAQFTLSGAILHYKPRREMR
jgi:hypothetical protein